MIKSRLNLSNAMLAEAKCTQLPPAEADELFFPDKEGPNRLARGSVLPYCQDCPIIAECGTVGYRNRERGVWGGRIWRTASGCPTAISKLRESWEKEFVRFEPQWDYDTRGVR